MKKIILLSAFVLCCCISCVKSGSVIPNVGVNFEASTNDPKVAGLNTPGGYAIINGYGVAGLILYRRGDGSYAAYDRCSTVDPAKLCAVTVDPGGFTVTDPCSGGKWALSNGDPVKAPAVTSLKPYSIDVSNFEIFVSN